MKETAYAIAGLLVLAAIYVGSYCVMVVPDRIEVGRDFSVMPEYRFGREAAHVFFRPVFEVDRRVRPERWDMKLPPLDLRSPDEHDDAP